MAHHDDVGFAAATGESELFSVMGPRKGEHVVAGEFCHLHGRAPSQWLFPDIGGTVACEKVGNGFVVWRESGRLHSVRCIEGV